jgi:hypothetical protein
VEEVFSGGRHAPDERTDHDGESDDAKSPGCIERPCIAKRAPQDINAEAKQQELREDAGTAPQDHPQRIQCDAACHPSASEPERESSH